MSKPKRSTKKKNLATESIPPIPPTPVIIPFEWAKICRLCEAKGGPFLNIFGADNTVAMKVAHILPFVVSISSCSANSAFTCYLIYFSYASTLIIILLYSHFYSIELP